MSATERILPKSSYLVEPKWKIWYRVGGVALLAEGIAYLVILVTSPMIGAAPGNNFQYVSALAAHPGTANFTYEVIALADLALVPGAIALYLALNGVNKSGMMIATAIILAYVVVDLLTFVPTALSLVALSQSTQTASVIASENSALSIVPGSQFFGWVVPPIAFLFYIRTLRKADLGRLARVFGIFTVLFSIGGGIGFLYPSITYFQSLQLPALAVYGIFFLGLGMTTLRLHNPNSTSSHASPASKKSFSP